MPNRDGVRDRKIILKLSSRTPSLLQDCASLPELTAESGLKQTDYPREALMYGSICLALLALIVGLVAAPASPG
ncbi:MAG: hypothetical protein WCH75_20840, partial [Candidatus Binatia bacterium]